MLESLFSKPLCLLDALLLLLLLALKLFWVMHRRFILQDFDFFNGF